MIINKIPIIICTNGSINCSRLKNTNFKRVIMDEASQSNEMESLMVMLDANQVILVGDNR